MLALDKSLETLSKNIIVTENEKSLLIEFKKDVLIKTEGNFLHICKGQVVTIARKIHLNPQIKMFKNIFKFFKKHLNMLERLN